jgi:hypothetical protein
MDFRQYGLAIVMVAIAKPATKDLAVDVGFNCVHPTPIRALLNREMILNVKPSVSRSKSSFKSATPLFEC